MWMLSGLTIYIFLVEIPFSGDAIFFIIMSLFGSALAAYLLQLNWGFAKSALTNYKHHTS